jgi:type IV pilus assembly protein PilW
MISIPKVSALRSQQGIGLIELMIAITLSLVIGGAVIQVFLSQRQTFRTQDDMARVQENARFAFEQIARDIRQVGYWGCSRKAQIVNETGNSLYNAVNDTALREESGVLKLLFVDAHPIGTVDSVNFTGAGAPRVVADCARASIFSGNTIPVGYPAKADIYVLSSVDYSISGDGLMRGTENLIDSGVKSIAFRYGVAGGTGWAESYADASSMATKWPSVVSVEVTLTLKGDVVGDQVFKSVVAVRNRLP